MTVSRQASGGDALSVASTFVVSRAKRMGWSDEKIDGVWLLDWPTYFMNLERPASAWRNFVLSLSSTARRVIVSKLLWLLLWEGGGGGC